MLVGGKCREAAVVYKVKCRCCNSFYIGKTQRYLKARIWEHVRETWKVIEKNRSWNSGNNSCDEPHYSTKLTCSYM